MLQDSLFSAFSNENFFLQTTMENYVAYNSSQSSFSFSSGLEYCGIGTKANSNTNSIINSNENIDDSINEYSCGNLNSALQYENFLQCQRGGSMSGLAAIARTISNTDKNNNSQSK